VADPSIPSHQQERRLKRIHVFVLGLCALCAQVIFIRELMALFTGTEFVIGALIAGWLVWVGIGGMAGGRIVGRGRSVGLRLFERFGVTAALLLPVTVAGIRIGRGMLCNPPGNFPPVSTALLFAILVIAPFGIVYGMLYNIASVLWRDPSGDLRRGISRVYIWEAYGSLAGAILFSFLLLELLSQFAAASVVSIIVIAVILLIDGSRGGFRWRIPSVVLAAALIGLAVSPIDRLTTGMMFGGYRVEASESSRYAEIVAASREGSITFFSGGTRLFSVPEPERTEETVHIPLLLHPAPRNVLLIGGSLGGGWREASKHGTVRRIDCLELDGSLVRLSMELGGDLALREEVVADGERTYRLDVIEEDGRHFLSRGRHEYDVIILSAPPPINLRWNRYYTRQFFAIARGALSRDGLFALSHPSSENFLSAEQVKVLGTIEETMRPLFDELIVLPGSTCHFIGGGTVMDPDSLVARLDRRGIVTSYVSKDFLPFRFSPERISSLRSDLDDATGTRQNTDVRPSLPYLELLLEGERLGSGAMGLLGLLETMPPFLPTALLGALLVAAFILSRERSAPRIAVLSVGLSAFVFQLAVMLSYQAHTGLLYHAIVLLTAFFMGGAAVGAAITARRQNPRVWELRIVHAGFVLLSLLLAAWHQFPSRQTLPFIGAGGFFHLLSALGGILTGAYYPLVVRTAFRNRSGPPALFYAYDLFGAAVGGMLGGLVIFPMVGVWGVVALIAWIHIGASLFLAGKW
jgi:spermidine synthase